MIITDSFIQHGFQIIDNFLTTDHYQALTNNAHIMMTNDCFKPAKIGQSIDNKININIRGDHIAWLPESTDNSAINAYLNQLENLRKTLNESLYLGLLNYEAHFAIYQTNSFYKKHIDQFSTKKDRRISCVYYLNPNWEKKLGGALKLYDKKDQVLSTILPIGNRFIFFNSDLPHEVETTYQTRYSIAAWLKNRSN
jgi:SM-20-related protein